MSTGLDHLNSGSASASVLFLSASLVLEASIEASKASQLEDWIVALKKEKTLNTCL